jgi:DNA-binding LacI/PurR family transcriptional regulator
VLEGDWSAASGYRLGREIVARPEITAVFSANDQMALGLFRRLHEAGRSIAVVGYDDLPEAAFFNPPLTSVRWDFAELGRRAVALVLDEIGARNGAIGHATIAPTLVERESSREARQSARPQ